MPTAISIWLSLKEAYIKLLNYEIDLSKMDAELYNKNPGVILVILRKVFFCSSFPKLHSNRQKLQLGRMLQWSWGDVINH